MILINQINFKNIPTSLIVKNRTGNHQNIAINQLNYNGIYLKTTIKIINDKIYHKLRVNSISIRSISV